jgi:septum formation protein
MSKYNIILASASPRRKELLKMLLGNFGLTFKIKPADIVETLPIRSSKPENIAVGFSEFKARETGKRNAGIIIGADTIVVLGNKILGKPVSEADAKKMLRMLSGRKHKVYTGISIFDSMKNKIYISFEKTYVTFRRINSKEIEHYINTGSPMDKAGAYGIQDDLGSTFVSRIEGDYFNVVGLPVVKTYLGLKKFIDFGV